ncbi:hypothetical protein, partial [Pseudomonas sp. FSL A6-1183]|uniref:hypothetical protein n=1 Tax=Pseudomonas sp. FSL A6-1183 TaxID=2662191 RepID=UPI001C498C60
MTDALNWQREGLPATETLDKVAQYLLWLCGQFQLQARNLTPGGSVPPLPPFTPMPNAIEFLVTGATPIITGANSAVFPQFVGYN